MASLLVSGITSEDEEEDKGNHSIFAASSSPAFGIHLRCEASTTSSDIPRTPGTWLPRAESHLGSGSVCPLKGFSYSAPS